MTDFLVRHFVKDSENTAEPAVRERYGIFSGAVGICLNLILCAGKFIAGLLTGAISITADAFNNLSDAASSVITLVGFKMAGQKADAAHPFGHGRIEYLTGLVISLFILLVGVELGKGSIDKIIRPEAVEFSLLSAMILLASVLVKLWMFFFNRKLGRRINSAAMAATAIDSLSDVAATSAVLLGLLVGHFAKIQIDGWVGLLVACFILKAGVDAARDTLNPLLGQAPDPELVRGIEETIMRHTQILGIHDLIIHDYGPGRRMMSAHAEVASDANILEAHDIIDHIERQIGDRFGIEAVLHMDPIAVGDARTDALHDQIVAFVAELDPKLTIHDFRVTAGPLHTKLIFDLVVPYNEKRTDEELKKAICQKVSTMEGAYYAVIQIDRDCIQ